jgi:hypothetical protein
MYLFFARDLSYLSLLGFGALKDWKKVLSLG